MRIVSYAWFRSDASVYESKAWNEKKVGLQFVQFLPMLVRAHHSVWSPWKMRIHYDSRVRALPYFPALLALEREGLIQLKGTGACESICGPTGMLARMLPVYEDGVEYVACRDIDSVPTAKDRACVEAFVASEKTIHTIHDAPAHCGMMGGLSTFKSDAFRRETRTESLRVLIDRYGKGIDFNQHGGDQHMLNRIAQAIHPEQILIHELDHKVGDLPGIIQDTVQDFFRDVACAYMPMKAWLGSNELSPVTGGCYAPLQAFDFYDDPELPQVARIREIEKGAGIYARGLLQEIEKL